MRTSHRKGGGAGQPQGAAFPPACRVCRASRTAPFWSGSDGRYWRCPECLATFLDEAQLPTREVELERYRLHQNDPADPGYRAFLNRLARPLLERLPPRQTGLDYGCGPGPALAEMLRAAGHDVHLYDPFFHPDAAALERTYDFVTCSEVVEHFHQPHDEFARIRRLLRLGGRLAVMTCFQTDDARFPDWHYRRDPTHVTFYREATFRHLAARFGWSCEFPVKDVALLQQGP